MIAALLLVPALAALACFLLPSDRVRRVLLPAAASAHAALTAACWIRTPDPAWNGWLALDPLGRIFLTLSSVLFLAASFHAVRLLADERDGEAGRDGGLEEFFDRTPEAVFTGCLLLFLATMTLVTMSRHLGLLWAAVEATTLTSAPLIYFHRNPRALEATWKYLMVCSVGIALALPGNFFFAVAGAQGGAGGLLLSDLMARGPELSTPWLRMGFLFFLVGYGTKMGLAPMHTWLPDAHSEAPSPVSALLSGALLNCAFLALLRANQVMNAAGQASFTRGLFLFFGFLSIILAAVFLLGQRDYKRLLAYSSVEHMGILAVGVGLGPGAAWAVVFHAVNHSLTKAGLFLTAGNILSRYKTKTISEVTGLLRAMPGSGTLWVAGLLAITGFPPFGTFLSEFALLKEAVAQGRWIVAAAFLLLLALIFMGMSGSFLAMAHGVPPEGKTGPESAASWLPPALLLLAVLGMGLFLHPFLMNGFNEAAAVLGGGFR